MIPGARDSGPFLLQKNRFSLETMAARTSNRIARLSRLTFAVGSLLVILAWTISTFQPFELVGMSIKSPPGNILVWDMGLGASRLSIGYIWLTPDEFLEDQPIALQRSQTVMSGPASISLRWPPFVLSEGSIIFELWFFLLIPATLFVIIHRRHRKRMRAVAGRVCPTCGYDILGIESGVCPECGTPIIMRGSAVLP